MLPNERKVKLVAMLLKGGESASKKQRKATRERPGKHKGGNMGEDEISHARGFSSSGLCAIPIPLSIAYSKRDLSKNTAKSFTNSSHVMI